MRERDLMGPPPIPEARSRGRGRELVESVLVAVLVFLLLRTFVLQAFRIPSPSMESTLLVGDFLFISKIDYGARVPFTGLRLPGLRDPGPGDVIVFRHPDSLDGERKGIDYIKRVAAVGGQTVEMRAKQFLVDGVPVEEAYVQHIDPATRPMRDDFGPFTVPEGQLFVLGDNRDDSTDRRFWGTVPLELVHGRAFLRYFSWDPQQRRPRWGRILTPVD